MTSNRARLAADLGADSEIAPKSPRRRRHGSSLNASPNRATQKTGIKLSSGGRTNATPPSQRSQTTRKTSVLPPELSKSLPQWLRFLTLVQKLSIGTTVLLTLAVFGVYGWTVYAQELWNSQYRKLEELKRFERQFTAAQGALEYNRIKTVEKMPGQLERTKPERTLFITAPAIQPEKAPVQPASNADKDRQVDPLGY